MKEEICDLQTEKNPNIPAIGGSAPLVKGRRRHYGRASLSIYVNSLLGMDLEGNRQF
jgi:hypothetical protein